MNPLIYHKKGTQRISRKEFKLMNVPRTIKCKDLENALACILHHNSFCLGFPDENNDITITVKHERAINILKDTWCINAENHLVQVALAYFQKSHLAQRNKYIGKFLGFSNNKLMGEILEVLIAHNAKYAYQKNVDLNTYVKFAT